MSGDMAVDLLFISLYMIIGVLYAARLAAVSEEYGGLVTVFSVVPCTCWPLFVLFEILNARDRIQPRKD